MLRDLVIVGSCAAAMYGWLCAVVSPCVRAVRASVTRATSAVCYSVALAAGGAILWTLIPAAVLFVSMMLEPRAGLALVGNAAWLSGVVAGVACWMCHAAATRHLPRIGSDFEVATALAIVALVNDDPATLSRVERLYRANAAHDDVPRAGSWALAAGN